MDRLVDHLLVFEGDGEVRDFPGNYAQYRQSLEEKKSEPSPVATAAPVPAAMAEASPAKKKMGFKEKREFEQLEKDIAWLTAEKADITAKLSSGDIPFDQLEQLSRRIGEVTAELDEKEMRWLELSELS
jgi:ATP-binding cassette subfamily F protein uup